LIKNTFLGIDRAGEAALTIKEKIWTEWQSTCYVIGRKGKQYTRQD